MSYLALYRKLRPKTFDDVIGQQHIIKTLRNQIQRHRITHAYLFCGTRGTGKTSTAKIFAKAVNCLNPENGQPCGKCISCEITEQGKNMNIIEIDAASNNSVENIRDIREEVKYPPTDAKYKVYIIDEVHMLSPGAFNALLKTLEEPPQHIIFILATTDPQKIPVTIHSRCQRFDFKRISFDDMISALKDYMSNESVDIDNDALSYIVRISDGAMRDALSILDRCISFYFGESISLSKVLEITGAVDTDIFFDFSDALFEQKTDVCMEIIQNISENGRDIRQFISEYIFHLRNILLAVSLGEQSSVLDYSADNVDKMQEQGKKLGTGYIINLISYFSELQSQMKYSSNERILLEVKCIKICNPSNPQNFDEIRAEIKSLEKKLDEKIKNFSNVSVASVQNFVKTADTQISKPKPKAIPEDIKNVIYS